MLILATLLGSIAVPLAFKARENLWDKFPSLAEKAAAILAADTSVVYFRTQDGEVYRCSVENHLPCSKVPPDAETTVRSSVASYINQPPGVYDLVMATTTLLVPQVLALCLLVMPKKHRLIDTNFLQSTIGA